MQAALNYMTSSEYSSIFSGLGIVNEPHPWTQAQLDTLEQFYERSYKTLSAAGVTTVFHHAFQGIDCELHALPQRARLIPFRQTGDLS